MTSEPQENKRSGILSSLSPGALAGISFFVGLFLGLVVLGWGVWPVAYENASPEHMRIEFQEEYVRMVIDSYNLVNQKDLALQRLDYLGESKITAWNSVASKVSVEDRTSFAVIQILNPEVNQGVVVPTTVPGANPGDPVVEPEDAGGSRSFLLWACVFTLIIGGVLVLMYLRKRDSTLIQAGEEGTTAAAIQQAAAITRDAQDQQTDYAALGGDPPIAQWMTTYLIGDDLFDDSFSIDAPSGEFMGECGVGIADSVGVGEPKRVSAFEVWLFDKNDIQTVTKVVMSANTMSDEASLNRLAAKGEPIQAMVGEEIVLETQTLQLIVRIVDMAYGEGAIPERSHFDRATLELAVWAKT